jgi:hypothetical protein
MQLRGRHCRCVTHAADQTARAKEPTVDLAVWIPLTVALGLGTLGLVYLFVEACDRV